MSPAWDHPNPFLQMLSVCPEHIDELGHTNNNVYSGWCQAIAWAHSTELGMGPEDYQGLQRAMAIQHASYDYLAPSFVGDQLKIATWLTAFDGRLTMERCFQIIDETTGTCVFRGRWNLVCINLQSNKPARVPKEFKEVYLPAVVKA